MFRRRTANPTEVVEDEPQEFQPWDPEFLKANSENQHVISSAEALLQSKDFHKYMRQHGGARACHDIIKKLQLYRDLRDLDPADFRKVWDDPGIKESVLQPVSFPLAATEYLVEVVPAAFLALCMNVPIVRPLINQFFPALRSFYPDWAPHALLVLFLLQLLFCWSRKHPSFLGLFTSIYYVQQDTEDSARTSQVLLARVVEVVCVVFSAGLMLLVSLAFKFFRPSRQSVLDCFVGVGMLREVRQPMTFEEEEEEHTNGP